MAHETAKLSHRIKLERGVRAFTSERTNRVDFYEFVYIGLTTGKLYTRFFEVPRGAQCEPPELIDRDY